MQRRGGASVASSKGKSKPSTGATIGFEQQLWAAADALRGSMDAAEYKHVVLGLTFLKYISDAFEEQHARLFAEKAQGAEPEDPDECRALGIRSAPCAPRGHCRDSRPSRRGRRESRQ
jgi:type I restriction enzyme M protein